MSLQTNKQPSLLQKFDKVPRVLFRALTLENEQLALKCIRREMPN